MDKFNWSSVLWCLDFMSSKKRTLVLKWRSITTKRRNMIILLRKNKAGKSYAKFFCICPSFSGWKILNKCKESFQAFVKTTFNVPVIVGIQENFDRSYGAYVESRLYLTRRVVRQRLYGSTGFRRVATKTFCRRGKKRNSLSNMFDPFILYW